MIGPCAKRRVICTIVTNGGETFRGENDCLNAQEVCPRKAGEGYEKCKTICQQTGHAEENALLKAGNKALNSTAILQGHYWICEKCGNAMRQAGIHQVIVRMP